jgi:hypothetical protein
MQRPSLESNHFPERRISRRSFTTIGTMGTIASIGALFAASAETFREDSQSRYLDKRTTPRNNEELLQVLNQEFGYSMLATDESPKHRRILLRPPPTQATPPQQAQTPRQSPPKETDVSDSRSEWLIRLSALWDRATDLTMEDLVSIAQWIENYRLSQGQITNADPALLDCNDRSNCTAERLCLRHGMPMHLVAFWPADPASCGKQSWHMISTCKLGQNQYLIIEHEEYAIIWHGSLNEYGAHYPKRQEGWHAMTTVPFVGISRYAHPAHDNLISKASLQILNHVQEEDMEVLQLNSALLASR